MTGGERGAATAELVMVLPLLVLVTWAMTWLVSLGASQARLVDAARETARAVARGDDEAVAVARGRASGPAGTTISVTRQGALVRVTATAETGPPVMTFGTLVAHQSAEATTEVEPCGTQC